MSTQAWRELRAGWRPARETSPWTVAAWGRGVQATFRAALWRAMCQAPLGIGTFIRKALSGKSLSRRPADAGRRLAVGSRSSGGRRATGFEACGPSWGVGRARTQKSVCWFVYVVFNAAQLCIINPIAAAPFYIGDREAFGWEGSKRSLTPQPQAIAGPTFETRLRAHGEMWNEGCMKASERRTPAAVATSTLNRSAHRPKGGPARRPRVFVRMAGWRKGRGLPRAGPRSGSCPRTHTARRRDAPQLAPPLSGAPAEAAEPRGGRGQRQVRPRRRRSFPH